MECMKLRRQRQASSDNFPIWKTNTVVITVVKLRSAVVIATMEAARQLAALRKAVEKQTEYEQFLNTGGTVMKIVTNDMNYPIIFANRRWSDYAVQTACVNNNLYTRGTYDQYDRMLKNADELQPTYENLFRLAMDICEHSEGQTIANVMFILEREAVTTTFEVDGSDEI